MYFQPGDKEKKIMILRYLTTAIITCCCTKHIVCLPNPPIYEIETESKVNEQEEYETTTVMDNSFPQSRFDVDDDEDIGAFQGSTDNHDKSSEYSSVIGNSIIILSI